MLKPSETRTSWYAAALLLAALVPAPFASAGEVRSEAVASLATHAGPELLTLAALGGSLGVGLAFRRRLRGGPVSQL